MKKMDCFAIIGGSGVYQLDGLSILEKIETATPYGEMSGPVLRASLDGNEFYFLARHGENHQINPSEVNYRANIFGLKKLGVNAIISISAVGSLKEEFVPGDFVFVDQFIDWTKGFRQRSFFDNGMVGHVSCADPVSKELQMRLYEVSKSSQIKSHLNATYLCIEGPQFSTRAESNIYRSFGAGVIGMTNVPEAFLAKEAGIAYATVAMITDYDCWKDEHCTLEEIMRVMKDNYISAQKLIKNVFPSFKTQPLFFKPDNENAVVTQPSRLNARLNDIIQILK